MVIQFSTISRFLQLLISSNLILERDKEKIICSLSKNKILLCNQPYDNKRMIERYYNLLSEVNEKGLTFLDEYIKQFIFPDNKFKVISNIKKYCKNKLIEEELKNQIHTAVVFVLTICPNEKTVN